MAVIVPPEAGSTPDVIDWVRADFGLPLASIDAVGLGADHLAELWRGVGPDGSPYAVKLSGGGTPAGLVVSARLAAHGVAGVPAPLSTRDGRLWSDRAGRRLSIVPWVSTDRALGATLDAAQWRSFGELLGQVHAIAVTPELAELLPREEHRLGPEVSTLWSVGERLDQPDHLDQSDHLVRALAQEWRDAGDLVPDLLERADELGRRLRREPGPEVVCHGDPHVGNVLLGGTAPVWLIDWDDAVRAPRERDLMFVIGGLPDFTPVSPSEQSSFFQGYGQGTVDPVRLTYYRCARALVDLADWAGRVLDVDRWCEADRADALAIVRGGLSEHGLGRLALTSWAMSPLRPEGGPPTAG